MYKKGCYHLDTRGEPHYLTHGHLTNLVRVHIRSEGILILKFECIYLIFEGRLRIQKRGSSGVIHLRANLFLVTKGNNLGKSVLYLDLTTFI
jgi:hypothetical protein